MSKVLGQPPEVGVISPMDRIDVENMRGQLSLREGAFSGFVGALGIILVVTAIIVSNGYSWFLAPRLIASAIYGSEVMGFMPILLGTAIHLVTGTLLGVAFAFVMPPIYRTMWMVAGLIFGIAAWGASTLLILPIIAPGMLDVAGGTADRGVLLIAHVVYGFILGMAGATNGMWWQLPKKS